jgi:hypothetical protein
MNPKEEVDRQRHIHNTSHSPGIPMSLCDDPECKKATRLNEDKGMTL